MIFFLALSSGLIISFVVTIELQQRIGQSDDMRRSRLIEPSISAVDVHPADQNSTKAIVEAMKRRAFEISESRRMQPSLELYSLELSRFSRRLETLETAFNFTKFFATALGLALGVASLVLSINS